jgi:hypothetical protein
VTKFYATGEACEGIKPLNPKPSWLFLEHWCFFLFTFWIQYHYQTSLNTFSINWWHVCKTRFQLSFYCPPHHELAIFVNVAIPKVIFLLTLPWYWVKNFCVKSQALKLFKIIKFKNETLGFLENEDSSPNTNEIVPKEKFNNLEEKLKFPLWPRMI